MKAPMVDRQNLPSRLTLVAISSIFLVIFLCVLTVSIHEEVRFEGLVKLGRNALSIIPFHNSPCSVKSLTNSTNYTTPATATATATATAPEDLRILIGILTLPDHYHRRHFLRLIYGTQSPPVGVTVDVKFVFCNLTKEDQKVLVALEIMRHNDIIILNCKENMDYGKTYTYFSSLPEIFAGDGPNPPYHYVMKADDDTYIRLNSFVESLRPSPREDLYYGFVIPCRSMDPFIDYMSGMGYLVSWDIVEWIITSDIPKNNTEGPEDLVFGDWLREGHRAKNRYNGKWSMYNFPFPRTGCSHELWPETIAVHNLKNQGKWIQTLKYFNVTNDLKQSKLYHIP